MKVEGVLFVALTVFFACVTPVYWLMSKDPTGTSALVLTTLLGGLIGFYALLTARRTAPRPEDRKDAEISEGAGELGFFSPGSWWPLISAGALAGSALGLVFGWWLMIIAGGFGVVAILGWVFQYYRGEHAH